MTQGLARQITLLRDVDGSALNQGRPAWANYAQGAWPPPHDPVFDFTTPARGYAWVDERAHTLAARLLKASTALRPVVGHTDWVWQNVGVPTWVEHNRFVAGFDWDSLAFLPESVVVGLSAGAYTQGSPVPPDAPSWNQVEGSIYSYQTARGVPFDGTERDAAENAAGWVRCYNARCQLDNQQRRGMEPPPGAFLEQMRDDPTDEHPQADRICDH